MATGRNSGWVGATTASCARVDITKLIGIRQLQRAHSGSLVRRTPNDRADQIVAYRRCRRTASIDTCRSRCAQGRTRFVSLTSSSLAQLRRQTPLRFLAHLRGALRRCALDRDPCTNPITSYWPVEPSASSLAGWRRHRHPLRRSWSQSRGNHGLCFGGSAYWHSDDSPSNQSLCQCCTSSVGHCFGSKRVALWTACKRRKGRGFWY